MSASTPSRYLMYKWFFFRNLPRWLSPMFHLESKPISIYFMWAPLQNEVGLPFFLFAFFSLISVFLHSWKALCLVFPLGIDSVIDIFLVVSKVATLKSPRGVGFFTGKTPVMWRPCFSLSVSRNQIFWDFQRKEYRAASTSCPWGVCNPFTPLQTSSPADLARNPSGLTANL